MDRPAKAKARVRALVTIVIVSTLSVPARAEKPAADAGLVEGRRQVAAGEYDAAVITLSAAVRRLSAAPEAGAEAAQAYIQLGIAYAGLGQASPAKSQFVQALMRDPSLTLDPQAVPPLALEAFAAARAEGERDRVVSTDRRPKGSGSRSKVLLGGALVAVTAGVVAVAGGQAAEPAPNPSYMPIITSPAIELVSASPSPGAQVPAGFPVSLTLLARNAGERLYIFVAESITADGRPCFSGRTQPFSTGANGTVTNGFPLAPQCSPPFTTETLNVWIQDVETSARPYHASYRGGYRVTP